MSQEYIKYLEQRLAASEARTIKLEARTNKLKARLAASEDRADELEEKVELFDADLSDIMYSHDPEKELRAFLKLRAEQYPAETRAMAQAAAAGAENTSR